MNESIVPISPIVDRMLVASKNVKLIQKHLVSLKFEVDSAQKILDGYFNYLKYYKKNNAYLNISPEDYTSAIKEFSSEIESYKLLIKINEDKKLKFSDEEISDEQLIIIKDLNNDIEVYKGAIIFYQGNIDLYNQLISTNIVSEDSYKKSTVYINNAIDLYQLRIKKMDNKKDILFKLLEEQMTICSFPITEVGSLQESKKAIIKDINQIFTLIKEEKKQLSFNIESINIYETLRPKFSAVHHNYHDYINDHHSAMKTFLDNIKIHQDNINVGYSELGKLFSLTERLETLSSQTIRHLNNNYSLFFTSRDQVDLVLPNQLANRIKFN